MSKKDKKNGVKGFWKDFRTFITKGNVVDLAVAVVIGAAFGRIVTSLVDNIIMPIVSILVGGVSVSDWKWVLQRAVLDDAGEVVSAEIAVSYGLFLQSIIDFLIIALVIFLALRIAIRLRRRLERLEQEMSMRLRGMTTEQIDEYYRNLPTPAVFLPKPTTEGLLAEIRNILKESLPPAQLASEATEQAQPEAETDQPQKETK